MNWTPITPETLPPENTEVVIWHVDGEWHRARWLGEQQGWMIGMGPNIKRLSAFWTHWAIPTPPGTPPAVPAEVAKVLGVDLGELNDIGIALSNYRFNEATSLHNKYDVNDDAEVVEIYAHIDAIRAARAALGMDTKEQQP